MTFVVNSIINLTLVNILGRINTGACLVTNTPSTTRVLIMITDISKRVPVITERPDVPQVIIIIVVIVIVIVTSIIISVDLVGSDHTSISSKLPCYNHTLSPCYNLIPRRWIGSQISLLLVVPKLLRPNDFPFGMWPRKSWRSWINSDLVQSDHMGCILT